MRLVSVLAEGARHHTGGRMVAARQGRDDAAFEAMVHARFENVCCQRPPSRRHTIVVRVAVGAGGHYTVARSHTPDADPVHLAGLGLGCAVYENSLRHNYDGTGLVLAERNRKGVQRRHQRYEFRFYF